MDRGSGLEAQMWSLRRAEAFLAGAGNQTPQQARAQATCALAGVSGWTWPCHGRTPHLYQSQATARVRRKKRRGSAPRPVHRAYTPLISVPLRDLCLDVFGRQEEAFKLRLEPYERAIAAMEQKQRPAEYILKGVLTSYFPKP